MVLRPNMRALIIGLFSLFVVIFSIDSVVAESEDIDVSIGFDFSFGEIIEDEKIISGTVVSSEEEIEISWEIYNSPDSNIIGEYSILNPNNSLL